MMKKVYFFSWKGKASERAFFCCAAFCCCYVFLLQCFVSVVGMANGKSSQKHLPIHNHLHKKIIETNISQSPLLLCTDLDLTTPHINPRMPLSFNFHIFCLLFFYVRLAIFSHSHHEKNSCRFWWSSNVRHPKKHEMNGFERTYVCMGVVFHIIHAFLSEEIKTFVFSLRPCFKPRI